MVGTLDELFAEKHGMSPMQIQNLPFKHGMEFEILRLASYKSWPRWAPIQPNRLSRGGFYFTGNHDEVSCFICDGKVKQWHHGDKPNDRHRRVNPECAFLLGTDSRNVPLPRPQTQDSTEDMADADDSSQMDSDSPIQGASNLPLGLGNPQHRYHTAPGDFGGPMRPLSVLLPDYQQESARLQTFQSWPDTAYVGPEELAQAGFVYLGSGDRVQCAFCKGVLRNWAPGDRAFLEHQKHFPQCPFVRNPTAAASLPRVSRPPASSTFSSSAATASAISRSSLDELGIETDLPKHHNYALEESRFSTFTNWPRHLSQKPEELAKAGFFYVGQADSVKCFWCDGGLRNWEPGDDPWIEHARWFPKCGHIKRTKGSAFIEQAKRDADAASSSATGASSSSTVFREIDQREVTARMDTDVVTRVLAMGFEKDFVRQVIEYRLRTAGDDFGSAELLLETVLQYTDTPPSNFPSPLSLSPGPAPTPAVSTAPSAIPVTAPASGEEQQPSAGNKAKKKNKGKKKKTTPPGEGSAGGEGASSNSAEKMETEESTETAQERAPECKVCMDAEVNIVFLPCGHLVCCSRCAPALRNCPICRALIRGTVNVFMA